MPSSEKTTVDPVTADLQALKEANAFSEAAIRRRGHLLTALGLESGVTGGQAVKALREKIVQLQNERDTEVLLNAFHYTPGVPQTVRGRAEARSISEPTMRRWERSAIDALVEGMRAEPALGRNPIPGPTQTTAGHLARELSPEDLVDARVERWVWTSLEARERQALFDKFLELKGAPDVPRYWTVDEALQSRLDALTHGHIDFDVPNQFLAAHDIDVEFVHPITPDQHALIHSGTGGIEQGLLAAFLPLVEEHRPLIDPAQISAWQALFRWLGTPITHTESSDRWDVIIVPGNRSDLKLRVERAAETFDRVDGAAQCTLLFSGARPRYEAGQPHSLPIGEAEAMDYYLRQLRPGRTYAPKIDSRALTTEETFYNAIPHIRQVQAAKVLAADRAGVAVEPLRVLVVTSPYHVRRAYLLANRILADDRLPLTREVHVASSAAMYTQALILRGSDTSVDRLYGARVYIQEMLKIVGGRAAGVF